MRDLRCWDNTLQTTVKTREPAAGSASHAPVIEVDMDAIYRTAAVRNKAWSMEFDSDGALFVWHGQAKTLGAAELRARRELADTEAGFSKFGARLVHAVGQLL